MDNEMDENTLYLNKLGEKKNSPGIAICLYDYYFKKKHINGASEKM